MPFSAQDIQDAGKIGLDFYLAEKPVDQIALERPILKALQGKKKSAPGAKQFVVEQLRARYSSNFQWFNGSSIVTYNRRQTVEQANYAWRSCHDGFALDEDRLAQNGIIVTDDRGPTKASDSEKIMLTNLIEEQAEVLRLGFQEQFSYQLHLDGTQSTDAVAGLELHHAERGGHRAEALGGKARAERGVGEGAEGEAAFGVILLREIERAGHQAAQQPVLVRAQFEAGRAGRGRVQRRRLDPRPGRGLIEPVDRVDPDLGNGVGVRLGDRLDLHAALGRQHAEVQIGRAHV